MVVDEKRATFHISEGRYSAYSEVVALLRQRAGERFAVGDDVIAYMIRDDLLRVMLERQAKVVADLEVESKKVLDPPF